MDLKFYKEALFSGMTGNAFKLGTVLSLGWFWARPGGCLLLYRGSSLSTIDFGNILSVYQADAEQLKVSAAPMTDLYVVRRANCCGMVEYGLRGLVLVRFAGDDSLAKSRPNGVFGLQAWQVASGCVEIGWFYCPLGQGAEPACFAIYINDVQVGTVEFKGKGFYSFAVEQLDEGRNCFAVRAEDRAGIQDGLARSLRFELGRAILQKARIVSAEAL